MMGCANVMASEDSIPESYMALFHYVHTEGKVLEGLWCPFCKGTNFIYEGSMLTSQRPLGVWFEPMNFRDMQMFRS